MSAIRFASALALVIAASGCAAWDAEARARDRAREWLECADVELARHGENAWRAAGCGRSVDVACTTGENEPDCIRVRFAQGTPEAAPASPSAPVPASAPALRAALDAHRDDILACVGRDRVVVRAAWTAEREITVALTGDLAGSAEEGCVRAALTDLPAPPSGTAGELLHVVR